MLNRTKLTIASLAASLAAFAAPGAETQVNAAAQTAIVIQLNGLSCSTSAGSNIAGVLSWNFGASNNASVTGAPVAAKSQASVLTIVKLFDGCSAGIFQAVMSGKHLSDITLTQSAGNAAAMTIKLTDVAISGYQVTGNVTLGQPSESVSFSFATIRITDVASGATSGWNIQKNAPF